MNSPAHDPAESGAPERPLRFDAVTRILHWAMAVLIVAMLFLGAMLVGSLGNYPRVLILHETTGVAVLILAVVRIGNRLRRPPPPMLSSISGPERMVATVSEVLMYVLFVMQPVVGWALVSASGAPIRLLGGVRLPAIAPHSAHLYHLLRDLHTVLAFGLLVVFTAHMCAVLTHTLLLRDQLLSRMTFTSIRPEPRPGEAGRSRIR